MTWLDDIANGLNNFVSNLGKASGNTAAKAEKSVSKTPTSKKNRVSTNNTISAKGISKAAKSSGSPLSTPVYNANEAVSSYAKNAGKATGTSVKASDVGYEPARIAPESFINSFQEAATKGLGIEDQYTKPTQAQQNWKEEGSVLDTGGKAAETQIKTPEEAQAVYDDQYEQAKESLKETITNQLTADYGLSPDQAAKEAEKIVNLEHENPANNEQAQSELNRAALINVINRDMPFIDPVYGAFMPGEDFWNGIDWDSLGPEDIPDLEQQIIDEGMKQHQYWYNRDQQTAPENSLVTQDFRMNPVGSIENVTTSPEERMAASVEKYNDEQHGSYYPLDKEKLPGFEMIEVPSGRALSESGLEELYADKNNPQKDFDWDRERERQDTLLDNGDITPEEYVQAQMEIDTAESDAKEINRDDEIDPTNDWQFKWLTNNVTDPADIKFFEDLQDTAQNSYDDLVKIYKASGEKDPEAKADEELQKEFGVTHDQIDTLDFDKMSEEEQEKWLTGELGGTMTQAHTYHKVGAQNDINTDPYWSNFQDELDKIWESDEQYYDDKKEAKKAFKSQTGLDDPEDINTLTDEEINKIAQGEGPSGSMTQAHQWGREEGPYVRNYNGVVPAARQGIERWAGMDFRDIGDWYNNTRYTDPETGEEVQIGYIPRDYYDNANGVRDSAEYEKLLSEFMSARQNYARENADFEVTTAGGDKYDYESIYGKGNTNPYEGTPADINLVFNDPDKTGIQLDDGTVLLASTLASGAPELDEDGNVVYPDGTKITYGEYEDFQDIYQEALDLGDYSALSKMAVNVDNSWKPMSDFIDVDPDSDNYGNQTFTWDQTEDSKKGMGLVDTQGGYAFGTNQFDPNALPATVVDTFLQSVPFMAALGLGAAVPIPFAGPAAGFISSIPDFVLRNQGYDSSDFLKNPTLRENMAFDVDPYTEGERLYDNVATGADIVTEGIGGYGKFKNMPKQTFFTEDVGNGIRGVRGLVRQEDGSYLKDKPKGVIIVDDATGNPVREKMPATAPINRAGKPTTGDLVGINPETGSLRIDAMLEEITPRIVDRIEDAINEMPIGAKIPAGIIETAVEEGAEELISGITDEWANAIEKSGDVANAWQHVPGSLEEDAYNEDIPPEQMWQNLLNSEATGFAGGATLGGIMGGPMYGYRTLKNHISNRHINPEAEEEEENRKKKVSVNTDVNSMD